MPAVYSLSKLFRSVKRRQESTGLSRVFHEPVQHGRLWTLKRQLFEMPCLQISFRFGPTLLPGPALLAMAKSPKELAFLGGTFLFGLGALEVCLRFRGF